MSAPLREWAELLSHLGHLGTTGRRPRILAGTITGGPAADGTVSASIMGGTPVDGLEVADGYGGGRPPVEGEQVRIEAIQYHLTVLDTSQ